MELRKVIDYKTLNFFCFYGYFLSYDLLVECFVTFFLKNDSSLFSLLPVFGLIFKNFCLFLKQSLLWFSLIPSLYLSLFYCLLLTFWVRCLINFHSFLWACHSLLSRIWYLITFVTFLRILQFWFIYCFSHTC